ncbi:MAG: PP2C family protein-serine/threonine phosphatase [Planctomycetota bacterium]|jgi:sigma-B regulation protein RsbU (phosphoserine phosphatase)
MSAFFRRRQAPTPPPPPAQPAVGEVSDSTQTMYVTGNARQDTDRIRMLVESLREVSSDLDPNELMVTMVDRAVKLVGAERGLLFTMNDTGQATLRVARSSAGRDLPRNAAFSTKVVETALKSGKSVCEKIDEGGSFDPSRSMIDLNIRAVMCVPLTARDQTLGALCVDTRASQRTFSRSELRYFEAFADMLAVVWSNRKIQEERLIAARMSQDLELARRIQTNLLPERPLVREGYAMCGKVIAAEETGGDYFDFFVTRDDKLVMAVGDVSGHGVAAALIMAAARAYLRSFCESSSSPATILRRVNRALGRDTEDDMFMSMFICVLDPHTREFHYANAGHTRPVLLKGGGSETESYRVTGVALGVEADSEYEERGPFLLDPGDTIVMFSDGLTELRNGDEQYGRERVIECLLKHAAGSAPDLLEGVFEEAIGWSSGEERHADDVTVAVLRADS